MNLSVRLRDGGFGDKDVYNIQLATDEAASNIIEHAYEKIKDGVLELSLRGEGWSYHDCPD